MSKSRCVKENKTVVSKAAKRKEGKNNSAALDSMLTPPGKLSEQEIAKLKKELHTTPKKDEVTSSKDKRVEDLAQEVDEPSDEPEESKRVISDIADVYQALPAQAGGYQLHHQATADFYSQNTTDYAALFSHMGNASIAAAYQDPSQGSFRQSEHAVEHSMGAMSYEDGQSMTNKMNTASTMNNYDGITPEERERFRHWMTFNKAIRSLYNKISPIQRTRSASDFKPAVHHET